MYNILNESKIISDKIETDSIMEIEQLFHNNIILVTGGAGTIGRALCKKMLQYKPQKVIVLDINELSLFTMTNDFIEENEKEIVTFKLGSILDYAMLENIFSLYQPGIVVHAAAYKHVPIAENNPGEVIKCNVLGTLNILNISSAFSAKHFIYLSSDKAVNPTSIMGATKRIGELLVKYYNTVSSNYFRSVRFGNVFLSSGSVSEIFKEQLIEKKKITITHPEMERYFMSISDAVNLILSAVVLYEEGELFICDMKQSVKIADLAKEIISRLGLTEEEVEIQYTAVRAGESLFEELCYENERMKRSNIKNIQICVGEDYDSNLLENVYCLLKNIYAENLVKYIQTIVPQYAAQKLNAVPDMKNCAKEESHG